MWENETLQGKRGVDTLLRCDSKVQAGNLKTKRNEGGVWRRADACCAQRRERIPSTFAMPRNAEVDGGAPEHQVDTYQRGYSTQGGTINSAAEQSS